MGKLWKWFLKIFRSGWFQGFLKSAVSKLEEILVRVGQEAYAKIKVKVAEVALMSIPSTQKAKLVFDYIKSLVPSLPDSAINYLLESLVQEFKSKEAK